MSNQIITQAQFIKKAKDKYGDKFDYSEIEYKGSQVKIKVICKMHGAFHVKPTVHLLRQGCHLCGLKRTLDSVKCTQDEVIQDFIKIHGDKYDYSKVVYSGNKNKVEIICKKHGSFFQAASGHKRGKGCEECYFECRRKTTEQFIKLAIEKRGNQYDYSQVIYVHSTGKIKILCKTHGLFLQKPSQHLGTNKGCPTCNESKGEKIISEHLINTEINFKRQYIIKECCFRRPLRFDFALITPKLMLIEFNGQQHYEIVPWSSDKEKNEINLQENILKDKIKIEFCTDNNIPLLIIRYDDKNIKQLIDNFIEQNR